LSPGIESAPAGPALIEAAPDVSRRFRVRVAPGAGVENLGNDVALALRDVVSKN
jgi:hypothetical protein